MGDEVLDRHVVLVSDQLDEYRLRLTLACAPLLAEADIRVLVHVDDPFDPGLPPTLERMLRSAAPLGVIVTSKFTAHYEDELISLLAELAVPMVHVVGPEAGPRTVKGDDGPGIRALMAHLLDERGIRRPVIVQGPPGHGAAIEREALVRVELTLRGLSLDEDLLVPGEFSRDVAHQEMAALLARRQDLDAVIGLNDPSALGAWQALTEAGLRVPQDVLVTGVDNQEMAATHWPGLTSIDHDLTAHGRLAAGCLLRQIRGEELPPIAPIPARLVVRGSTSRAVNLGFSGLEAERDAAVEVARSTQAGLSGQEAVNGFREALMRCGSLAEVLGVMASTRLDRLGIVGYALALYESPDGELAPSTGGPYDVRVLLQSWGGQFPPTPADLVPVHDLPVHTAAPDTLLAFQPLATSDRALGYIVFEQASTGSQIAEVLRMDLSRTLGAVLAGDELAEYARSLERQVNRRTQELEKEVSTRRSAEVQLQRLNVELQRSLMIDGLTRIANRAAFQQHLQRHSAGGERDLALLFVDVDLFKQYNDHYGHVAGDAALCQVAACLARATLYPDDLACRWGGEEFAALLPGSGLEGAYRVAERFAEMLHDADIPHELSTASDRLSASVGIAVTRTGPDADPEALIAEADRALYLAKAQGRNRINVAGHSIGGGSPS